MIELFFILIISFPPSPIDDFFNHRMFEWHIKRAHIKIGLRLEKDTNNHTIQTLRSESSILFRNSYPNQSYFYNFGYAHHDQTKDLLIFSNLYSSFCKYKMSIGGYEGEIWGVILKENEHLYRIYDLLDDALRTDLSLFKRRQALHRLKLIIGDEDFYRGKLPPSVPIWRFSNID